ncbi:hypothetical protein G6N74_06765 [Mesorhizobium sp. CGMCC 1.15528]|uniref:DUF930 domain-containing protein n=1 Tax=Mesorhizobium zhangyense TaxID=1776730 RepID=A0A7C9R5M4_9HYPH|nr:hypothetical protein [Mesorhizobium zhangyense]NGN40761.1 hypothetical protein [Mesorhizobium zhangyense]
MSRIAHFVMAAAVAAGSLLTGPNLSQAADVVARQEEGTSLCSDQRYLNKIIHRFGYQVKHVPNLPDVAITDFQNIYPKRYEPVDERHPIARLYCGATASLSDGRQHEVFYLIEGRMGFAGIGDNVEFCLPGFDRWMVYNGRCRVLR